MIQSVLIGAFAILGRIGKAALTRWICGICAIALVLVSPYIFVPSLWWGPAVRYLPFFLAGLAAGGVVWVRPPTWLTVASALCLLGLLGQVGHQTASVFQSLVLVSSLWLAWSGVDRGVGQGGPVVVLLRHLGTATMAIYLSHTMFSAAVRVFLLKIGIDEVWIVLAATFVVGVGGPLLLLSAARKFGLVRFLGF